MSNDFLNNKFITLNKLSGQGGTALLHIMCRTETCMRCVKFNFSDILNYIIVHKIQYQWKIVRQLKMYFKQYFLMTQVIYYSIRTYYGIMQRLKRTSTHRNGVSVLNKSFCGHSGWLKLEYKSSGS